MRYIVFNLRFGDKEKNVTLYERGVGKYD